MLNCKYCGKECKNNNSLKQHEIRCKENPNKIQIVSNFIKYNEYRKHFNIKGENQFTKARRLGLPEPKVSEETRLKISNKKKNTKLSKENIDKLKISMKLAVINNPKSYSSQNVNGRVKKIKYKDIILDSKWEYIVAEFLDKNNIIWERPTVGIQYQWMNDTHLYFPDFYLSEYDIFLEVKGYIRERDLYKWKSINNLLVIAKKEINQIKNNNFNIIDIINMCKQGTRLK